MLADSPLATPPTPSPTQSSPPPALAPGANLGPVTGRWLTWDVTALTRAWLAGEVPDDGLALAPAPEPDADPETAGDLIVARWLAVDDPATRPYLIVESEVQPVTPTPAPVLPPAGGRRDGERWGWCSWGRRWWCWACGGLWSTASLGKGCGVGRWGLRSRHPSTGSG